MATNIYYKEIEDPVDPDAPKIPVRIDDLFRTKLLLGEEHFVPKERESGIFDSRRDLSNLLEVGDDSNWLPPLPLCGNGEKTNIYTDKKDKDFIPLPTIKDVNKEGILIDVIYPLEINAPIEARQTITLPEKYRDRWVFFSVDGVYSGWYDFGWTAVSGGFLPPGTTEFNLKNPIINTSGYRVQGKSLWVHIHEVTIDETVPYDPNATDIDLSDVYTDKGEERYGWWTPLLFLGTSSKSEGDSSRFVFANLPEMAFDWLVLAASFVTAQQTRYQGYQELRGTKKQGETVVAVQSEGSHGCFIIGIEIERRLPPLLEERWHYKP